MKRQLLVSLALVSAVLWLATTESAFGRGGRGGGGGMRGGGGGMAGGGMPRGGTGFSGGGASGPNVNRTPSFSQPAARPANAGGARPNATPSRPSTATSAARPGAGTRPSTGVGSGTGSRPETGSRPGINTTPSTGTRPGVSTRPSTGAGIASGVGTAAGIGARPGTLPGLSGGRPGAGDARPQASQDRRDSLQSRLQGGRAQAENRPTDRRENADQRREDRQGWSDRRPEDWQSWADHHYGYHDHWHHGYWHDHAGSWWNHMWDEHTAAMVLGTTAWGLNRLGYTWGYWTYVNPYWVAPVAGVTVYDYSQPLVVNVTTTAEEEPAKTATGQLPPGVTPSGLAKFDEARAAFYDGQYADSLKLTDAVLKEMPKDALVHEFRSLVLFALGRYSESAAAIHAVLAVGPGWDWTTLASMYSSVDTYTGQLRALEKSRKEHPDAADVRFLLGYHYQTAGHTGEAAGEWKQVVALKPNDTVAAQLLQLVSPTETTFQPKPAATAKAVPPEKLVGTWTASGADKSKFTMTLTKDGNFTWSYARGATKQEVQGVFALDQSTLALEMDDGSTMLADIDFANPSQFQFKMIGGDVNDSGLQFKKS